MNSEAVPLFIRTFSSCRRPERLFLGPQFSRELMRPCNKIVRVGWDGSTSYNFCCYSSSAQFSTTPEAREMECCRGSLNCRVDYDATLALPPEVDVEIDFLYANKHSVPILKNFLLHDNFKQIMFHNLNKPIYLHACVSRGTEIYVWPRSSYTLSQHISMGPERFSHDYPVWCTTGYHRR
jgi:hypothetical protein